MKYNLKSSCSCLVLIWVLSWPSAFAGTCPRLFSDIYQPPKGPFLGLQIGKEDSARRAIALAARLEIGKRERAYRRMLSRRPNDNELRTFDTVVIGGGVQSATFLENSARTRTLLINASDSSGVFGSFGDTFFINSEELLGLSSPNKIPGSNIQVSHFATASLPTGRTIGDVTDINLAATNSEFLRNTKGIRVLPAENGSPARWKIETTEGVFYADNVAYGAGMGGRKFPFKDQASLRLANAEENIHFIDDFMTNSQKAAEQGKNNLEKLRGKRVAVIGGGDGGAITAEFLRGLGPPEGYGFPGRAFSADELPSLVHWFGQKASTGKEYKSAAWERYWRLADEIDSGAIQPVPHHAEKIVKINSGPDKGAYRLYWGKGENDFVVVDQIIVSAGYDSNVKNEFFSGIADVKDLSYPIVLGNLANGGSSQTAIARSVSVGGNPQEGLYLFGPATGGLETAGLPGGPASPRIEVLGPRTQALAQKISNTVNSPRDCITCGTRQWLEIETARGSAKRSSEIPLQNPESHRASSEEERRAFIKVHLISALSEIKIGAGRSLKIDLIPVEGKIRIQTEGLSQNGHDQLMKHLSEQENLLSIFMSQQEPSSLTAQVKALPNGQLELKKVAFPD